MEICDELVGCARQECKHTAKPGRKYCSKACVVLVARENFGVQQAFSGKFSKATRIENGALRKARLPDQWHPQEEEVNLANSGWGRHSDRSPGGTDVSVFDRSRSGSDW